MTDKPNPRIPAGMRDILPADMIKRQYVIDVLQEVFESYGFEPLQTSAIELTETLMGKHGEDAERLIYKAWYGDTPDGEFSLRYDLTVPLSRFVAMNLELPRPLKRYQIAPVWRADRPQKGRYREFFQCDVDIVGTESMLADAECVAIVCQVLTRLGFEDFIVLINSRKVLAGIGQYAGVPESLQAGLYRSIDKLDKIGLDGVRAELLAVGVPSEPRQPIQKVARLAIQGKIAINEIGDSLVDEGIETGLAEAVLPALNGLVEAAIADNVDPGQLQAVTNQMVNDLAPEMRGYYGQQIDIIPEAVVDKLLGILQIEGSGIEALDSLQMELTDYPIAVEGIEELRAIYRYLDGLGVPNQAYAISFAMVRGLEYYTGPIFETTIRKPKAMPSIVGGGRYDRLIGLFSGVDMPATGLSFGIERIIDAMDELNMFPAEIRSTTAEVLVTVFDADSVDASLALSAELRAVGINTAMYFEPGDRLGDQIGFALTKGIPYVIVMGPDEIAAGQATIRRLGETAEDSKQRTVARDVVGETIRNW